MAINYKKSNLLMIAFATSMLFLSSCSSMTNGIASNQGYANDTTQIENTTRADDDFIAAYAIVDIFNDFMIPFFFEDKIANEDFTCIQQAENDFAVQQTQQAIDQYFSVEQKQEMNQFFATPLAIKMAVYYKQVGDLVLDKQMGKEVDNQILEEITPPDEEINSFMGFIDKKREFIPDDELQEFMDMIFDKKVEACQVDYNVIED